ncbi:MAG: response regulator, partial [Myxococcota bacterium]
MDADHKQKLGDLLVRRGTLTAEQRDEALVSQGRTLMPLGSSLIELGLAEEADVCRALAEQCGVPAIELSACRLRTEELNVIPEEVALNHRVLPVATEGSALKVALADPADKPLLDEIAFASGKATLPFVAPRIVLERVIKLAYAARRDGLAEWAGPRAPEAPHVEVVQAPAPLPAQLEQDHTEQALSAFPAAPPAKPRALNGKPLVLAVDDEVEILDIIDRALTKRGFEVMRATRGREALQLLQTTPPDIVLLDAMLPEIHGFEICSHIKKSEQFRHIPVIIISAIYTGWNYIQDVKRIHKADGYIEKPFRVMSLVRSVEDMLASAQGEPTPPPMDQARIVAGQALREAADAIKQGQFEQSLSAAQRAVS